MAYASRALVNVYVDCTNDGQNAALLQKYGVRGFPTVLFLDPDGKVVERLGARDPASVKAQIEKVAARFQSQPPPPPRPRPPGSTEPAPVSGPGARVPVEDVTLDEGLTKARDAKKLLAVIFTEPEATRRDPQTEKVVEALTARGMDQLPERFVWVRRPLCDDIGMPTPEAEAHRAEKAPSIVFFDPWAEAPQGRPFPSLFVEDDLKELRTAIERATVEAARAGHPPKEDKRR